MRNDRFNDQNVFVVCGRGDVWGCRYWISVWVEAIRENVAMCDDREVLVYEKELVLLKKVFEKSSDLVKARYWDEFREQCGGISVFEKEHEEAVTKVEEWYADGSE